MLEECNKTHGTIANMGYRGLKGLLKEAVPWVVVFWCLAHHLELSLKDALKITFFTATDELLLQVYFMYEKSPKKCHELEAAVEELKACLGPAEMLNNAFTLGKTEHTTAQHSTGAMLSACVYTAIVEVGPKLACN